MTYHDEPLQEEMNTVKGKLYDSMGHTTAFTTRFFLFNFFLIFFIFFCLFVFVFVLLGFFGLVWGFSFKSGFNLENRLQGQMKRNGEIGET